MQNIKLLETEITQGLYMAEQGVTLSLILPNYKPCGDLSASFNGYYQGSEYAIDAVLADGYEICATKLGTAAIFDVQCDFVTDSVDDAIERGIIRRVVNA